MDISTELFHGVTYFDYFKRGLNCRCDMTNDQQVHEQLSNASDERSDLVRRTGTFERRRPADLVEPNVEVASPAIEFRNVNFSYEDKKVLNDLSFQLAKGEIKIILSG